MTSIYRQLSVIGWGRALVFILIVWFLVMVAAILPMISNTQIESAIDIKMTQRLQQALVNMEALKQQNNELRKLLSELTYSVGKSDIVNPELLQNIRDKVQYTDRIISKHPDFGLITSREEPNPQYEHLRRRIINTVQELSYLTKSEISAIGPQQITEDKSTSLLHKLQYLKDLSLQHNRAILKDLKNLAEVDGFSSWREKEAKSLSDLVQRRLEFLQNPRNCSTAKKLICTLNKGCGYGCQLHHVVFCLTVAYGTKRTLVLSSKGWRYNKAGWEQVFLPIGSCPMTPDMRSVGWPGSEDAMNVHLPIIDNLNPSSPFLPPAIPEDLAPRIQRLHGDPVVWWISQLMKYLLKYQPQTQQMIDQVSKDINFQKPIVGIHVRRTDKIGTEASFHPFEEYMKAASAYYDQLELTEPVDKRRIYIATDDPTVIKKAKKDYPNYEILGDAKIAETAAMSTRYSVRSLNGIILDIHFLSSSDFLVCTFSSQVCRVAYELMQNQYPDASAQFRSLDDIYYYGGGGRHLVKAHIAHEPGRVNEISLQVGDKVHIAGNHWDGFSKGLNLRHIEQGLFPSFKVEDIIHTVKFPTYPEVPLEATSLEKHDEQVK